MLLPLQVARQTDENSVLAEPPGDQAPAQGTQPPRHPPFSQISPLITPSTYQRKTPQPAGQGPTSRCSPLLLQPSNRPATSSSSRTSDRDPAPQLSTSSSEYSSFRGPQRTRPPEDPAPRGTERPTHTGKRRPQKKLTDRAKPKTRGTGRRRRYVLRPQPTRQPRSGLR